MRLQGTPIDLLTTKNPHLYREYQTLGSVTKDADYLSIRKNNIVPWPDFTYENIVAAMQNTLTSGVCLADVITERHPSPFEIENEDVMDDIIKQWNVAICKEALKHGARTIQEALGLIPNDITIRFRQKNAVLPASSTHPKHPDFSIFLKDDQKTVLVWGETKLSSKWNSDSTLIHESWQDNWIWPWRQILSYCVSTNTRYGCLVTPEEFVALRVYRNGTTGDTPYNIQYQSIPWDNQGEGKLTVNLCLWAIGMLALNEGHRPIVQQADMLPINVWWKDRDSEGHPEYEHHLTGLRVRKMPRSGEARERPSRIREVDDMAEQSQRPKRSRRK